MVRRSQGDCYSDVKEAFFSFLLFSLEKKGRMQRPAADVRSAIILILSGGNNELTRFRI